MQAFAPQQRAELAVTQPTGLDEDAQLLGAGPLFFDFGAGTMTPTLRAARSHRERDSCATPTSCAKPFALMACGPINRPTIRLLNAVLYTRIKQPTLTPRDSARVTAQANCGRATTILTPGGDTPVPAEALHSLRPFAALR